VPRYKGATIPSRSFKFLQILTQEDDDKQNVSNNTQSITINESSNSNTIQDYSGARRSSKTYDIQTQPVSQKYETRSEAFMKTYEPKNESMKQSFETRAEAISKIYEPGLESVVKKFQSSSQSIVTSTSINQNNFDSNFESGMF
jgi:hypothetical protein